ncbi:hypothetical protein AVEN_178362-1 [Araneus ventricosus]|uniref:CCHC-type domain-containing protein n=1 Tax=Araneus ventricosus TaxID=182803 RepID=A0A4Y2BD56_ARAVE|nr:hypothetical protein AVEN_178362-1 [Araneus ventricosus]
MVSKKRAPSAALLPPSDWDSISHPNDPGITYTDLVLPPVTVPSAVRSDTLVSPAVSRPGSSTGVMSPRAPEGSLFMGDSSEDTSDSNTFYDTAGTPRVPGPCDHLFYLNDKLIQPPRFDVEASDSKMDEDAPSGHRKRPAGKISKSSKKKMSKGSLALASKPEPSDSPAFTDKIGTTFQGEVPSTPPALLGHPIAFDVKKEFLKIVAEYTVPTELVDRLMDFMSVVERLISGRDQHVQNIDSRLRVLETTLSTGVPSSYARALRSSPAPPTAPAPPLVPRVEELALSLPGPSGTKDGSWKTVSKKGKSSVAGLTGHQESGLPPRAASRPTTPVPVPPPRPEVPTVIVKPKGDTITASAALKGLLEVKISPQALGVRVLRCQPANGNGVLVRVETTDMADKLVTTINSHPELQHCCEARTPRKRSPQILIYDIPDKIFASFGAAKRLHWGFGSFRFREYCEPLRCFKCYKFGHVRVQCSVQQDLCSKCPGIRNYNACIKERPICRNYRDYNARNRNAPRLPIQHTAISDKCPLFLREKAELKHHTNYV